MGSPKCPEHVPLFQSKGSIRLIFLATLEVQVDVGPWQEALAAMAGEALILVP